MKMFKLIVPLLALTTMSASAVSYIKQTNLEDQISVNGIVENVRVGNEVPMPVITWGADMRTKLVVDTNKSMGYRLELQDNLPNQMKQYLSGYTPLFRGTMSQVAILNYMTRNHPDIAPVVIIKLSDSRGGDVLVTKNGIKNLSQLCEGKRTIVSTAYGPHLNLLNRALKDGGCSAGDVNLKWVADLTESENSPLSALYDNSVDAAFVISPDASIATACASNCGVGDGTDDSVVGARSMFSTRTAGSVTMDVIAVRRDYFDQHRQELGKFVHQMLIATESADAMFSRKDQSYTGWLKASANLLFNDSSMYEDAAFLYKDAYNSTYVDNISFFLDKNDQRNFTKMTSEVSSFLVDLKLIDKERPIAWADWNFEQFASGIKHTKTNVKIDNQVKQAAIEKIIEQRRKNGTLEDTQFIKFPIFFQPNTKAFTAQAYSNEFASVIEKKSVYPGAVLTLEGHCDPLEFQKVMLKNGYSEQTYGKPKEIAGPMVRQSCYDTGIQRAMEVRDAIIKYAKDTAKVDMIPGQFQILSHGLDRPKSGICNNMPCKIKTKAQWLENMRVEVGVTVVEAESSEFELL